MPTARRAAPERLPGRAEVAADLPRPGDAPADDGLRQAVRSGVAVNDHTRCANSPVEDGPEAALVPVAHEVLLVTVPFIHMTAISVPWAMGDLGYC